MDFYSPHSHRQPLSITLFLPSVLSVFPQLFLVFLFFFGNHIETPYVPPLSQATDVCNGNSRHRGKKLPRPDGGTEAGEEGRG